MNEIHSSKEIHSSSPETLSQDDLTACLSTLEHLAQVPELCLTPNSPFEQVLQKVSLLTRRVKSARKQAEKQRDQNHIERADIRVARECKENGRVIENSTTSSSALIPLSHARRCYICKVNYSLLHPFYDMLCPNCAQTNLAKRIQTANLDGKVAFISGGRIKIGFQIALILLRAGARVAVSSRFPADTMKRYLQEIDHEDWLSRLTVHSADFRYLPTVEMMCESILEHYSHLDILINNAAQTVRRPPEYYRHLLTKEKTYRKSLPSSALQRIASNSNPIEPQQQVLQNTKSTASLNERVHISTLLSQTEWLSDDGKHSTDEFPSEQYDSDGQQIDRRVGNSWVADLHEVQLPELLEVHAVNSLVPFLLIQRFLPRMDIAEKPAFIINVSAMEGHFTTGRKTGFHPHTNMAKASMNMITRTCGERFAKRGIYMNSVDTGWVTNEYPFDKVKNMQDKGFQPPLDEIDGAARVLDPIFVGINSGKLEFGKFFKDYQIAPW